MFPYRRPGSDVTVFLITKHILNAHMYTLTHAHTGYHEAAVVLCHVLPSAGFLDKNVLCHNSNLTRVVTHRHNMEPKRQSIGACFA